MLTRLYGNGRADARTDVDYVIQRKRDPKKKSTVILNVQSFYFRHNIDLSSTSICLLIQKQHNQKRHIESGKLITEEVVVIPETAATTKDDGNVLTFPMAPPRTTPHGSRSMPPGRSICSMSIACICLLAVMIYAGIAYVIMFFGVAMYAVTTNCVMTVSRWKRLTPVYRAVGVVPLVLLVLATVAMFIYSKVKN